MYVGCGHSDTHLSAIIGSAGVPELYDELCEGVQQRAHATAVCMVVIDGIEGSGAAVNPTFAETEQFRNGASQKPSGCNAGLLESAE
jgi:hypothetical protein